MFIKALLNVFITACSKYVNSTSFVSTILNKVYEQRQDVILLSKLTVNFLMVSKIQSTASGFIILSSVFRAA